MWNGCPRCSELSEQQSQILRLSWDGMSLKEIGAEMGLSDHTVKNYRLDIYRKFKVNTVEQMLRLAVDKGYLRSNMGYAAQHMEDWP